MKRQILIATLTAAALAVGNCSSALAFKGMGSGSTSSSARTEPKSMVIEGHQGNRDTVIALVNDQPVTMGALVDSIRETMLTKYGNTEVTEDIARTIRKEAFEKLVLEELACQRARTLGISVDPAFIKKQMDARRAAAGGEEKFQESLTLQGTSVHDLERLTERFYLVSKLIDRDIDEKIIISQEQVDQAYESSKEQFAEPERVKISDIIFFLDPDDPESREKVLEVRKKAIEEMDGNISQLQEPGLVVRDRINVTANYKPELYKNGKNLKEGSFSEPLLIDGTLHLIKLESYHPRKEPHAEQAKAYILSQMKSMEKSQRLPIWRNDLLRNGNVEITHDILR